jgi:hypothetical protein
VFFLLRHSLDTRLPISIMLVLGVAATSVLAAAMYFGVERRFRRVRPVPAAA